MFLPAVYLTLNKLILTKEVIMPNKDGTGPEGKGSKTGRGLGNCSSKENDKENSSDVKGRGQGRGKGSGQGKGQGLGKQNRGD